MVSHLILSATYCCRTLLNLQFSPTELGRHFSCYPAWRPLSELRTKIASKVSLFFHCSILLAVNLRRSAFSAHLRPVGWLTLRQSAETEQQSESNGQQSSAFGGDGDDGQRRRRSQECQPIQRSVIFVFNVGWDDGRLSSPASSPEPPESSCPVPQQSACGIDRFGNLVGWCSA